jgi:hypothetical protein
MMTHEIWLRKGVNFSAQLSSCKQLLKWIDEPSVIDHAFASTRDYFFRKEEE